MAGAPAPDALDLPLLPPRKRGRQTATAEADYQAQRAALCRLILQIRSTLDFQIGARR